MAKLDRKKRRKKQRSITSRLMRGIILILFLTVLIPAGAYYSLPEWFYYLTPATRLYFAMDDIENAYGTEEFDSTLRLVEKRFDSNIEIYTKNGRFIYSTAALTDPSRTGASAICTRIPSCSSSIPRSSMAVSALMMPLPRSTMTQTPSPLSARTIAS